MRKVAYVALGEQHRPLKGALLKAVGKVLDRGDFILGKEVVEFERRFARYCGARFAVGLNSGTDALFLALKAFNIGPGDEVITAPNSFLASASVVAAAGATPVFVDITTDLNIDADKIEAAFTPRTKAIIPVHLCGLPAKMDEIMRIARARGLKVIEDAAQAVGADYRGKRVGAWGDAGAFSLHPLKTLNACGDAGAIITDDEDLYRKLTQLRNIGLKNRDESDFWGYNSRLDTVQAAMLLVKLGKLEAWTRARRKNAAYYLKHLAGIPGVDLPREPEGARAVYHTFVIQADRRDELQRHLEKAGIGSKIHYPIPIHLQKAAAALGLKKGDFPVAERCAGRILSLPVHQDLKTADLAYVCERVREFYGADR